MSDKSHLKQDITLSKHEPQQQQQELRRRRRRHQQVTKNRFRLRAANRNSSATMAWATSTVAAAVPGTGYVSSTRQTRILDALRGSWFSTVLLLLLLGQNRRNNIVVATTFSTKTNINKNKWLVETAKGMMLLAAGDCSGQGGSGVSSGPKAIAPLAYASLTGCTSALLTFLAGCRQPLPPMQFLLL